MSDELRRSPRVTLDTDVEVTLQSDRNLPSERSLGDAKFQGRAHDISLGGMFILTPRVVPFGTHVSVRLRGALARSV